jgi:hypothetical protein
LALALAAPVALAGGPSATDLETARALFKQGLDLRAAGNMRGALEKFQAAHALGRTPVTGIELARTYDKLGLIVEALETATDVGRIPVAVDETDKSATARRDAAAMASELRPRVPTLVTRITTQSAAALVVTIDGRKLPEAAIGQPYRVNPGTHEVSAHFEGGDEVKASVSLAERETKTIELAPPAPKEIPKPSPLPGEVRSGRSIAPAIVGFVAAGGAVVAGTVTGIVVLSDEKSLENNCTMTTRGWQCGQAQWNKMDEANILATISTISFVVAGAGAAFGLAWLLLTSESNTTPKRGRIDPVIGPGFVGAHGTF